VPSEGNAPATGAPALDYGTLAQPQARAAPRPQGSTKQAARVASNSGSLCGVGSDRKHLPDAGGCAGRRFGARPPWQLRVRIERHRGASPINYLAVRLKAGERWRYEPPAGHTVLWVAMASGIVSCRETRPRGSSPQRSRRPMSFRASAMTWSSRCSMKPKI
jgi:hypothetical protein